MSDYYTEVKDEDEERRARIARRRIDIKRRGSSRKLSGEISSPDIKRAGKTRLYREESNLNGESLRKLSEDEWSRTDSMAYTFMPRNSEQVSAPVPLIIEELLDPPKPSHHLDDEPVKLLELDMEEGLDAQ